MRKMKDSGIEWIGQIPENWKIVKFKNLGFCRNGLTYSPEDMCDSSEGTLVLRSANIQNGKLTFDDCVYVKSDIKPDLMVKENDILICSRNGSAKLIGKNAIIPSNLCATFGAFMLIYRCSSPLYLRYILNSSVFTYNLATFLTSTVNQLTNSNFLNIQIPYTSDIAEQTRIANFLDQKCSAIDSVLEKTKASIEEYKKLKQSVITQAVTKGIRPNRQMKDSGIEWVGKIPEDWEIKRLNYIANSFTKGNGITKEDVKENGEIQCVRYGEIYSKYNFNFSHCYSRTNLSLIQSPKYITHGNILFACTGELVEEIGKNIVYTGREPCLAGGDIIIMEHSQNPIFLNYALNSYYCQSQKSKGKVKLKVVHISATEIGDILTMLPPIAEQQAIADYLDKKCAEIDNLIAKKELFLKEIETYKKSLIYEYVTGKKEVI